MKAVVLEIKNKKAAVLAEDGSIKRIPDNGYSIGLEIEIPAAPEKPAIWTGCRRRFAAAAACAAMAVVVGGGFLYASETVFAYSTVDIKTENGVIQMKLNRKDQLISVTADHDTDTELAGIISGLLQEHSSLDEAVAALSESIDSEAEVSVQSSDCGHAADLREEVEKMMPAKPETAEEGTDISAEHSEKNTTSDEKSSLHTSAQNDQGVKAEDGRSVPSGKEKKDRYDALPSGKSGGIAAGMSDPADAEQDIPGNENSAESDPDNPEMSMPEGKQAENPDAAMEAVNDRAHSGMAVPADEELKDAGKDVTEGNNRNDTEPEENISEKIGSGGPPSDSHFDAAENNSEAEPAADDPDSAGRKQPRTSGNKNAAGQAETGQPPH